MRTRRLAVAAAVAGLALPLLPATPTTAAPTTAAQPANIRPDRAAGSDALYMIGLDIHLRNGRVITTPLPKRYADETVLLGRSPRGWVVGTKFEHRGGWYYLISHGVATRIAKRGFPSDLYSSELLSEDGLHVVTAVIGQANDVGVSVMDLDGNFWNGGGKENAGGDIRTAADDEVYISGVDGIDVLDVSTHKVKRISRRASDLVSVEHDTVFVKRTRTGRRYGPTDLSNRGKPRWLTPMDPRVMSPGGTYVLGNGRPDYSRLQVRRMSDGKLVRVFPAADHDDYFDLVGWASDHVVLSVAHVGERQALRRCHVVTGKCALVTPFTTKAISLPTSSMGALRTP